MLELADTLHSTGLCCRNIPISATNQSIEVKEEFVFVNTCRLASAFSATLKANRSDPSIFGCPPIRQPHLKPDPCLTVSLPLQRLPFCRFQCAFLFFQDAHKGIAAADKYKGVVDCFTRVQNEQVSEDSPF